MYTLIKEKTKTEKRRVSVSGVLKKLGVSKSGYLDYKYRKPSKTNIRKERVKTEIEKIHTESKGIYGAPKIRKVLQKNGEVIAERTVCSMGKRYNIYMDS